VASVDAGSPKAEPDEDELPHPPHASSNKDPASARFFTHEAYLVVPAASPTRGHTHILGAESAGPVAFVLMSGRIIARALGPGLLVTCAAAVASCGSSPNKGSPSGSDGGPSTVDATTTVDTDGSAEGDGSAASAEAGGSEAGGSAEAGAVVTSSQSVLQRGNDIYRRATFVEPALMPPAVAMMAPDTTFNENATFPANGVQTTNQGTASVLYLQEGPTTAGCPSGAAGCTATGRVAGAGMFFAFPALASNPNVVAFDESTGLTTWSAHVTNNTNGTNGGDGIRGTPVIDPTTRRLFVVTGNGPHTVHALSVDSGVEITTGGWPVTLASTTVSYGDAGTFNSPDQNQHGALLLLNDILYIPFGGEYGDGGQYLGWIVAIDTTNPTSIGAWATRSPRSGIWGSGGLASDGTYVFGVTGDTTSEPRNVSDSQEVVRVTGLAQFTRDEASVFFPTEWTGWDKPTGDLDFGASTPAFVPLPAGSNPPSLLIAPAKAGRLFVLNGADLSAGTYPNAGGALADIVVANTTAESMYTAPTIYTSSSGLHAAINAGDGPFGCPTAPPNGTNEVVLSISLQPGQSPIAQVAWCAVNSAGGGHLNYPPISTTTDGVSGNPIVWFLSGPADGGVAGGNQLTGVDGQDGSVLVRTTGAPCTDVPSMSFPIAVKNRIVVAALGHLCSWSINGQ